MGTAVGHSLVHSLWDCFSAMGMESEAFLRWCDAYCVILGIFSNTVSYCVHFFGGVEAS